VDIFDGKGVRVGTSVNVGCMVGTMMVAVGDSMMAVEVAVSTNKTGVGVGFAPHAARRKERRRMIVFFMCFIVSRGDPS
jgi:hypothetical protein